MCRQFWQDESGMINPASYILMVTVVGIGMIAGLTAIRDSVVQELGDTALALENFNQGYSISVTLPDNTVITQVFVDDNTPTADLPGQAPFGIVICGAALPEGATGGGGGGGPLAATPE